MGGNGNLRNLGKIPFMGEMMTCIFCGRQEKSGPATDSNWRAISFSAGQIYYGCPAEFPPEGSSAQAFDEAYRRFIWKVFDQKKGGG
jgi:hypothetical protein